MLALKNMGRLARSGPSGHFGIPMKGAFRASAKM
jgi:hypothetical protein